MRPEFKLYCHQGAGPSIVINNAKSLTNDQYVDTLRRIRDSIANGIALDADDCTLPGMKSTSCNWGLCSSLKDHYPSPELHTFPQDFVDYERMSALGCANTVKCPMRIKGSGGYGCFYSCRVFSRRGSKPTREEALALYDEHIERATKGERA